MSVLKAEALFKFEATADVELGLKKGDVVIVRRTTVGDGWWEGEKDGKRGLFPSSYVKLLSHGSPVKEKPKTPLTPQTKKAFMESLLNPATSLQDELYDQEKASELFVWGHDEINITAGPMWECRPPPLTVVINSPQMETRFSGMKHYTVYEVETKELGSVVPRKYKHFLWLYDRMAELFPCVSLPPLPVKQFSASTDAESVEARRRGLEKFLRRVANHPVLGSTKLFRDFLTVRDDKDWKIGRNLSIFKFPKSTKKMFTAPVYHTVKYPPFNVPLNQLASIERFSQFSRVLETNFHAMQQSCTQISMATRDTMTNMNMFGRDLQRMAKGLEPTTVQRRKHSAATSLQVSVVNGQSPFLVSTPHIQRSAAELEEESSGEDTGVDITAQWNWREDHKFTAMLKDLYDIANGMKRTNYVHQKHQEAMENKIMDALREYSGIIHTLPVLVKLHEEAMELYNASREKDSKKEAEEVRQHCETLNNILLSEFDYFSKTMVRDFETIISRFLKEQASYHRQLAEEWDTLHRRYTDRLSSRRHSTDTIKGTESFKSKSATFKKSGSYNPYYTSSEEFSTSLPLPQMKDKGKRAGSGSSQSPNLASSPERPTNIPKYINVERREQKEEDDDDIIDEEMLKPPPGKARKPPPPPSYEDTILKSDEPQKKQDIDISARYEVSDVKVTPQSHNETIAADKPNEEGEQEEEQFHHPYANWDIAQANNIAIHANATASVQSPAKKTSTLPKKPMPIQRKRTPVEDTDSDCKPLNTPTTPPSTTPGTITPATAVNATGKTVPKKPLPPQKPRKLIASPVLPSSSSQSSPKHKVLKSSSSVPSVSHDRVNINEESSSEGSNRPLEGGGGPLSSKSVINLGGETKPRSYTVVEQLTSPERKQPMLPPASKLRSKSPSPSSLPNTSQTTLSTSTTTDAHHTTTTTTTTPNTVQLTMTSSKVSSKPVAIESVRMRAHTSSNIISPSSSITSKPPQLQKMSSMADATPVSSTSKVVASAVLAGGGGSRHIANKKSTPSAGNEQGGSGGGQKEKGKDELMRKLSLRRQRIEQQTALVKPNISVGKIAEAGSERNSTISTSSSHSEVVVAYRRIEESSSMTSLSSNSTGVTGHSDGGSNSVSELKRQQASPEKDGGNLAKYGIIEDVDGGSFVI